MGKLVIYEWNNWFCFVFVIIWSLIYMGCGIFVWLFPFFVCWKRNVRVCYFGGNSIRCLNFGFCGNCRWPILVFFELIYGFVWSFNFFFMVRSFELGFVFFLKILFVADTLLWSDHGSYIEVGLSMFCFCLFVYHELVCLLVIHCILLAFCVVHHFDLWFWWSDFCSICCPLDFVLL